MLYEEIYRTGRGVVWKKSEEWTQQLNKLRNLKFIQDLDSTIWIEKPKTGEILVKYELDF